MPLSQILFYRLCYWIVLLIFTLIYRARFLGVGNIPSTGGVLIVANHQSHFDPPLVGIAIRHRNMSPIGRRGLFANPIFGAILRGLGTIPIDDEKGDAAAIRTAITQLQKGRIVLIFPEGTRSPDGQIKQFKRGTWLLLARSNVPVIPAAVEGCFDAFPRGAKFPRIFGKRIAVKFGAPIHFSDLKPLGPDQGLALLTQRVESIRQDLRERLIHPEA